MTKATFGGSGSQGILLQNDAGTINFNNLTLASTAGKGIDIEGESGTVQFAGTTTVSGSTGTSVNIESLLSTGSVTFDNLAVNNRQGGGLAIDNASGERSRSTARPRLANAGRRPLRRLFRSPIRPATVTFNGAVNVVNATGNPGVNLQNNSGTTTFSSLNVSSTNGTALFASNGGTLDMVSERHQRFLWRNDSSHQRDGRRSRKHTTLNVNLDERVEQRRVRGPQADFDVRKSLFVVYGDRSGGTAGSGGNGSKEPRPACYSRIQKRRSAWALMNIDLNSNGVGIQAQNASSLVLGGVHITNSTSYGVDALDVKSLSDCQIRRSPATAPPTSASGVDEIGAVHAGKLEPERVRDFACCRQHPRLQSLTGSRRFDAQFHGVAGRTRSRTQQNGHRRRST